MFCPSCGAPNNERDQRYCRECGATLPVMDAAPKAVARRPTGTDLPAASGSTGRASSLVTAGMKNRAVQGAVIVVVFVVALYVLISTVIHVILYALLPLLVLVAIGFVGYMYLKNARKR